MKIDLRTYLVRLWIALAAASLLIIFTRCSSTGKLKQTTTTVTDSSSVKTEAATVVKKTDSSSIVKKDSSHKETLTVNFFTPVIKEIDSAIIGKNGTAEDYTTSWFYLPQQPAKKKSSTGPQQQKFNYNIAGKQIETTQPVQSITLEVDGHKTEVQATEVKKTDSTATLTTDSSGKKTVTVTDTKNKTKRGISVGMIVCFSILFLIILFFAYLARKMNKRIF